MPFNYYIIREFPYGISFELINSAKFIFHTISITMSWPGVEFEGFCGSMRRYETRAGSTCRIG